jgi:GxxExxY protein
VWLKDDDLTYAVIGRSRSVYNEFGFGLLESAYVGAMVHACTAIGLHVEREVSTPLYFDGVVVANYRIDLVIEHRLIVEIKACKVILPEHLKQVFHYLKCTDLELALLLNFGRTPEVRRLTYRNSLKKRRCR